MRHSAKYVIYYCAMDLNKRRDTGYNTSPQKHNIHSLKFNGGTRIDKQLIANRFTKMVCGEWILFQGA